MKSLSILHLMPQYTPQLNLAILRNIALPLIAIVCSLPLSGQTAKEETGDYRLEDHHLKGNVKKAAVLTYKTSEYKKKPPILSQSLNPDSMLSTLLFDTNGFILEVRQCRGGSRQPTSRVFFTRDAVGLLQGSTALDYNLGDSTVAYHKVCQYNDRRQLVSATTETLRDGHILSTAHFDHKGNLSRETWVCIGEKEQVHSYTDAEGRLQQSFSYCQDGERTRSLTYDSKGNLLEYLSDTGRGGKFSYEYLKARIVKKTNYMISDGESALFEKYEYDSRDLLIKKTSYNRTISVTDSITHEVTYPQGLTIENNYTYNQYGDRTTEIATWESNVIKTVYRYVYDKQGNWVEQKTFIDGILMVVEERKIEYYE